jgi:hypothetical protein
MKQVWLGLVAVALLVTACGDDEGDGGSGPVDAECGDVTCASGEYCCDAACGLCVEMEVACNMTCEE